MEKVINKRELTLIPTPQDFSEHSHMLEICCNKERGILITIDCGIPIEDEYDDKSYHPKSESYTNQGDESDSNVDYDATKEDNYRPCPANIPLTGVIDDSIEHNSNKNNGDPVLKNETDKTCSTDQ